MTTRADDPRLLTAEQLADIEVCRGADYPVDYLLRHIDAQTAENAELRARAERAEARVARVVEEASRAWELAAHRGAQLRSMRTAANRIAADPTAEGARELAALVLGGDEL